jgi:uncharacterized phage-associated protein
MIYSAQSVANAFIELARSKQENLTNMQVQKLVYFAHGWHLALTGKPLIKDAVKAWNFGPVIPPLYNALKKYGDKIVADMIPGHPTPDAGGFEAKLIDRVMDLYGHLSGLRLSAITHLPGSPWDITYQKEKFSVIDDDLIRDNFRARLKESEGQNG